MLLLRLVDRFRDYIFRKAPLALVIKYHKQRRYEIELQIQESQKRLDNLRDSI
jgi:hypothetical protein